MGFDFSNASGESFGNIEDVFFKKDGKSILTKPEDNTNINLQDLTKSISDKTTQHEHDIQHSDSKTVINISKELLDVDEDVKITLTDQEERRMRISTIKNKSFIDIDTGSVIIIMDKTEMYNGVNLYAVKQENGKIITYPRSKFIGKNKQFIPKDFYVREAERAIEDTIIKYNDIIYHLIIDANNFDETSDGRYLELLLETPIEIIGGMVVPDKVQIPVKRIFDLEYKVLMLESVICLDNKIASLLFSDIWF